jgi:peptide/nickel transport system substrate-binding protein
VEYTAQLLQQDLAKIGLRIEIRIVNFPTFQALTRRRGKVAFAETGWNMDFPDPSDFFEPLFSSKSINDEDSDNTSFYKNARVDELLEEAHHELDARARDDLYEKANAIVCDEAPWAFTHSNQWYDVWQPYVRGFRTHPVWTQQVRDVWLDREDERRRAAFGTAPASGLRALGSLLGTGSAP